MTVVAQHPAVALVVVRYLVRLDVKVGREADLGQDQRLGSFVAVIGTEPGNAFVLGRERAVVKVVALLKALNGLCFWGPSPGQPGLRNSIFA